MIERRLGKYLTLEEFCTCTQTYQRFADQIDPFPKNLEETLPALEALCQHILDPVIDGFGRDRFQLTYGFCSVDLKRWLARKDPLTGKKHGIATPSLDQHMAREVNRNGRYYCDRLGAACDLAFKALGKALVPALKDALRTIRKPHDQPLQREPIIATYVVWARLPLSAQHLLYPRQRCPPTGRSPSIALPYLRDQPDRIERKALKT
jgi:hypothetical protein